jgi:hypothetical protein
LPTLRMGNIRWHSLEPLDESPGATAGRQRALRAATAERDPRIRSRPGEVHSFCSLRGAKQGSSHTKVLRAECWTTSADLVEGPASRRDPSRAPHNPQPKNPVVPFSCYSDLTTRRIKWCYYSESRELNRSPPSLLHRRPGRPLPSRTRWLKEE